MQQILQKQLSINQKIKIVLVHSRLSRLSKLSVICFTLCDGYFMHRPHWAKGCHLAGKTSLSEGVFRRDYYLNQ